MIWKLRGRGRSKLEIQIQWGMLQRTMLQRTMLQRTNATTNSFCQ